MLQLLSNVVEIFRKSTRTSRSTPVQKSSLGLEVLEGRALPSVSPIHSLAVPDHVAAQTATIEPQLTVSNQLAPINFMGPIRWYNPVPNVNGLDFHLISLNGKPAHDLVIQSETYNFLGNATITGNWIGDKNEGVNPISNGSIYHNGTAVDVSFSWNGAHDFNGTLTWVPPSYSAFRFSLGHWHLDGNVTVPGNPNGGPGHVEGDAYVPLLRLP